MVFLANSTGFYLLLALNSNLSFLSIVFTFPLADEVETTMLIHCIEYVCVQTNILAFLSSKQIFLLRKRSDTSLGTVKPKLVGSHQILEQSVSISLHYFFIYAHFSNQNKEIIMKLNWQVQNEANQNKLQGDRILRSIDF